MAWPPRPVLGPPAPAPSPAPRQVYTWVNLSNTAYQQEWARLGLPTLAVPSTKRAFSELKYAFRSLQTNGLWERLNRIYIVIDRSHGPPSWLDLSHRKVVVVPHDRIFANKTVLPTRNFNAIMSNIHRIPGLSKWFIFSSDNFLLGRPIDMRELYDSQHSLIHTFLTDGIYPSTNSWQVRVRLHPAAGSVAQPLARAPPPGRRLPHHGDPPLHVPRPAVPDRRKQTARARQQVHHAAAREHLPR